MANNYETRDEAKAEAAEAVQADADAELLRRQADLVARLIRKNADALAVNNFDALIELKPHLVRERNYLERLKKLPTWRDSLRKLISDENWKLCKSVHQEILAVEHGHSGYFAGDRVPHLNCCGNVDPTRPCVKLGLWDTVAINGRVGLITSVEDCYGVLLPGGEQKFVALDSLARAVLVHDHTGTYSMHAGSESAVLFGPGGPRRLAWSVGDLNHWSCCGQTDVFAPCAGAPV